MEEGISLVATGKTMKDQKEKIGNSSFNGEMHPRKLDKETTILDSAGRKGWEINAKSHVMENKIKSILMAVPL